MATPFRSRWWARPCRCTARADYRIVVVRDITARKQAQEREAFIALHDSLTQLPNRHFLMEQLSQVLALARAARPGGRAVHEPDHFKTVNDSLGHHAGDQLLRNVAEQACATARERRRRGGPAGWRRVCGGADRHPDAR